MGRRIMGERRPSRTVRIRRYRGRTLAGNNAHRDTAAEASLRAFVRALARKTARECFVRNHQGCGGQKRDDDAGVIQ